MSAAVAGWRAVPLGRALDDARLLGSVALYPRQRSLLEAVDAGPRIHVQALGRRSGKTMMAALYGLHSCVFRPDLDALVRPRETRYAVVVATNLAQARLLVAAARSIVEASPMLSGLLRPSDVDELRFELPDGARTALRAMPCNSRGVRGMPISTLVFDELAHFLSETEGPQVADRVFTALTPATAQFGALARVLCLSTPWGTDGLFADLFHRAASGELADAVAVQAPTAEMNPTITPEFLALEEARDPDTFRAEYLAQFEGSGSSYLDFERFLLADRGDLPPEAGTGWVAGLDPAFSSDPFGVALVGRAIDDPARLVVACSHGFRAQRRAESFEEGDASRDGLLDAVAEVCVAYRARAVSDQYAARPVVDRLQRAGVSVRVNTMTATSKTAAFAEMRARLYNGSLELHNDLPLVAELRRLRSRFTAGQASVVSPRVGGSHGDRAQALALAVYEFRHLQGAPAVPRPPIRSGEAHPLAEFYEPERARVEAAQALRAAGRTLPRRVSRFDPGDV